MAVDEHTPSMLNLDPGIFQQPAVNAFQTGDLAFLGPDEVRPGEIRLTHVPAVTGRVLECFAELAGKHQQLFGHAAPDHAGTAQAGFLAQADACAIACRNTGRSNTA